MVLKAGGDINQSEVGLNYLLRTSKDPVGSKFLLVGFSAIRPVGDFTYNYNSSLEDIDANVLFILDDFGDQGSYYYADHGDLGIFNSVQQLLTQLTDEHSANKENVIMFGSSKGRASALLHGIPFEAGHVYVGAPQTKIGTYLTVPHPNVLELITEGRSDAEVQHLGNVLFSLIKEARDFLKTTIVVGNADHHLENHAVPLKGAAERYNHSVGLSILRGVSYSEIRHKYRLSLHGYINRVIANLRREIEGAS